MKPTIIDKYLDYLDTLPDKPDKPAKYKISIMVMMELTLSLNLILIPILIGLIVYIIPYIIYRRCKVRKAMKNEIDDRYMEESTDESEETEC